MLRAGEADLFLSRFLALVLFPPLPLLPFPTNQKLAEGRLPCRRRLEFEIPGQSPFACTSSSSPWDVQRSNSLYVHSVPCSHSLLLREFITISSAFSTFDLLFKKALAFSLRRWRCQLQARIIVFFSGLSAFTAEGEEEGEEGILQVWPRDEFHVRDFLRPWWWCCVVDPGRGG